MLPLESVTSILNAPVSDAFDGDPLISPVLALIERPAGRLPKAIEYVYGGYPPDATGVEL